MKIDDIDKEAVMELLCGDLMTDDDKIMERLVEEAKKFPVGTQIRRNWIPNEPQEATGEVITGDEYIEGKNYESQDKYITQGSAFYSKSNRECYIAIRWFDSGTGCQEPKNLDIISLPPKTKIYTILENGKWGWLENVEA